jgi:hypothetical protein
MIMKIADLWDVTPPSPIEVYRHSSGSFPCCGLFRRLIADLSLQGSGFNPRIFHVGLW